MKNVTRRRSLEESWAKCAIAVQVAGPQKVVSPRSRSPCYDLQNFPNCMPTMPTAPITKPTVIIVDDDSGIRESISSLVRSVGFQPKLMASVDEFLQSARPEGPSCLVLDVRLPAAAALISRESSPTDTSDSRSFSSRDMATSRCRCRR